MIGINEDDDNLLNSKRKEKKCMKKIFFIYIYVKKREFHVYIINNLNSVEYWKDDVLMT